jgi:hypothetical protein
MFSDYLSQKFFIQGFLKFIFDSILGKKKDFQQKLKLLAERHYERGVKAVEYGIIGEVDIYNILKLDLYILILVI